ncbi:hypothetical protein RJ639_020462 [Escallonia herrerae]|uniref:Protein kinase domain-containing protein n=1 Tax=Escallonia herrerae TaxID=1293975 RepID=A0AA88V470_9ASTE|nr:hypothetical protein RJ639_020462 [Escallonia herrerae]
MVHKADLVIIGISVGVAVGLLIAFLIFFGIRWYKRRAHLRQRANEHSISVLPIRTNGLGTSFDTSASLSSSVTVRVSDYPAKNPQSSWWSHHSKDRFASASGIPNYPYKDIQRATQGFTTVLGQGSFGPVYKAIMPAGEVVAVKVSLLGRLHHRNLVNLVGYCVDKGQRMLVYQFMSNGSLANFLCSEEKRTSTWDERLQIALDISHGIEYLHDGAVPPVINQDLKSANILLDQFMRAKKEVYDDQNSGLKGTYGYIDLVYISTNKFTMKSDIYSFGVAMSPDGVDEILDTRIIGECNPQEARSLAHIAHKCLHKTPRKRPSIGEVSQAILKIKQRRLVKEDTMSFVGEEVSRVPNRIERQQTELRKMASIDERAAE